MSELEVEANENRDTASDLEDPIITAEDLAKMAGVSIQYARRLIAESGIGEKINARSAGRPQVIVRYSKLLELREDYIEHYSFFNESVWDDTLSYIFSENG